MKISTNIITDTLRSVCFFFYNEYFHPSIRPSTHPSIRPSIRPSINYFRPSTYSHMQDRKATTLKLFVLHTNDFESLSVIIYSIIHSV